MVSNSPANYNGRFTSRQKKKFAYLRIHIYMWSVLSAKRLEMNGFSFYVMDVMQQHTPIVLALVDPFLVETGSVTCVLFRLMDSTAMSKNMMKNTI